MNIRIEDRQELIGFLRTVGTACCFVTADTETVMIMNKTRLLGGRIRSRKTGKFILKRELNPYFGTVKVAKRNGFINANFVKACQKRYAELHNLDPKDVEYEPGETHYIHCQTEDGKPLCLCQNKAKPERKYMQFFPIQNLGETIYIHPTLGRLNPIQIKDMYDNWVSEEEREEWKPRVIILGIDSIRTVKISRVKILNDTATRLAGRMAAWRGIRVDTARPAPVVVNED